jgi:hypothetical protein
LYSPRRSTDFHSHSRDRRYDIKKWWNGTNDGLLSCVEIMET